MEQFPEWIGRFTFVQIAAPTRSSIEQYQSYADRVHALAERINQRFANRRAPVILLRAEHHDADQVFEFYRAADLCFVSSLHDGMNLVAKEFVAARDDEHGVLVLSALAGAAQELEDAVIINPYDIDAFAAELARAIKMPSEEQAARMRAMRKVVAGRNVFNWASDILEGLESLWTRPLLYSVRGWEETSV